MTRQLRFTQGISLNSEPDKVGVRRIGLLGDRTSNDFGVKLQLYARIALIRTSMLLGRVETADGAAGRVETSRDVREDVKGDR